MSFIKLDRKILDSEVWANSKHLKIWIWMLAKANYKTKFVSVNTGRGETTVKIERGQFLFGRFKAEQELDFDGSLIYRTVKKFEEMGMIEVVSNSQYSIITICKYEQYQTENENSEQAMNNQRTTNAQAMNSERTSNEQPMNTTKKGLEVLEGIEIIQENEKFEISEHEKLTHNLAKEICNFYGHDNNLWMPEVTNFIREKKHKNELLEFIKYWPDFKKYFIAVNYEYMPKIETFIKSGWKMYNWSEKLKAIPQPEKTELLDFRKIGK